MVHGSGPGPVVRLRRIATPPEPELLGLALGNLAVSQFASGRGAAADATLTEQLQVWRRAFEAPDLRLAEKLEGMAGQVQKGFGRRQWVIDLLREAVVIRQAQPVVVNCRSISRSELDHALGRISTTQKVPMVCPSSLSGTPT